MSENTLAHDEAQRTADYEAMKSNVKAGVGGEIAGHSRRPTEAQSEHIGQIAANMRSDAVSEIAGTGRTVERGRFFALVSQIVDYLFFVIYGLLAVRLMLALFAANNNAGFVRMIKDITDPLYAPFKGIVPSLSLEGGFTLVLPIIVALVVYSLLHLAINGLLRLFVQRKTVI